MHLTSKLIMTATLIMVGTSSFAQDNNKEVITRLMSLNTNQLVRFNSTSDLARLIQQSNNNMQHDHQTFETGSVRERLIALIIKRYVNCGAPKVNK